MRLEALAPVDALDATQWNRLNRIKVPFLGYEFLAVPERNQRVGERQGSWSRHLVARDGECVVAAVPAYGAL